MPFVNAAMCNPDVFLVTGLSGVEVDGIDALQLAAWSDRPVFHPSRVWPFVRSFSPRPRVIYTAQAGGERGDHDVSRQRAWRV